MKSKELMKLIEKDGWYLVNVKGSHHQFKHPTKLGRVTIPHLKKSLWRQQKSKLCQTF